jgi:hypothetical protein
MESNDRENLHVILNTLSNSWQMVGSRFTCDPPPTDTDEDYILLTRHGAVDGALRGLIRHGFELNTDDDMYEEMPEFWALRKGVFNVIVTDNLPFYERFLAATALAKQRNLLDKQDRINLFRAVLYEEVPA